MEAIAIPADLYLDSRIRIRILIGGVFVPKVDYLGKVWEWNTKFMEELETLHMTAA